MFRTTAAILVAGAMLAGCESNRVVGDASYGDRSSVRRVDGGSAPNLDTNSVARVDATDSSVNRVDAADRAVDRVDVGSPVHVPPAKVTRVDATDSSVKRVTPADHASVKRTDVEVTRRTDDAQPAAGRVDNTTTADRPAVTVRAGDTTHLGTLGGKADPERAAFANTAVFPKNLKASDDHHLTAVVDKRAQTIKIANASDKALRNARVWVNGAYVILVPEMPANRTTTMRFGEFSDRAGTTLPDANLSDIQIEAGDQLYNVQGPVFE